MGMGIHVASPSDATVLCRTHDGAVGLLIKLDRTLAFGAIQGSMARNFVSRQIPLQKRTSAVQNAGSVPLWAHGSGAAMCSAAFGIVELAASLPASMGLRMVPTVPTLGWTGAW